MNSITITKSKHVENSWINLYKFGAEVDLASILVEEFKQGLASDISNGI